MKLELLSNQAALVLSIDENGEVTVDISAEDSTGLPSQVCTAIATKLLQDEDFQSEIMDSLDEQ